MKIITRKEIESVLCIPSVLEAIERGFVAYSLGEAVIPPVAALHFDAPRGDCHIKYGYAKSGRHYVIKIASGFYDNDQLGLPSNHGLMLLFDKQTGAPVCGLLDEGFLTDIRTAAAGSIAAKYLAPKNVECVGIIGTGAQALYQLKWLTFATTCRKAIIWGRDREKAKKLTLHPELWEWKLEVVPSIDQLAEQCHLIVTATSSSSPLLFAHQIQSGTHITAVGADDQGKQELDPKLFEKADCVVVDSRSQCAAFGDTAYALQQGLIRSEKLIELGELLAKPSLGRISDNQITLCDLTGVAIQDLQIAESIYNKIF
jgi:ornithine cyclodeaminase